MKIKVVRIITASYVIPWHLHNTLSRVSEEFDVYVIGQNVSEYKKNYPHINFFDININRKISLLADINALIKLIIFFKKYKPDIVHSIMPKAGFMTSIAGYICRVPVRMHTFTGQLWVANNGMSKRIYYLVDKLINFLNTVCLTDSFSQSKFLLDKGFFYKGKSLPVLGKGSLSGVDINKFQEYLSSASKISLRLKNQISSDTFVFAFIARKTYEKGALDMLKAFYNLNLKYENIKLLFVGPDENHIIEKLHKTNQDFFKNVIEFGSVKDTRDYILMADVLCLPSHREGFGSIIIDAASMGVPSIGTKIDGLVDAIDNNVTGLLFNDGDIKGFENSMELFLKNPKLKDILGKNALNRVKKDFSADYLYDELKNFYYNFYGDK